MNSLPVNAYGCCSWEGEYGRWNCSWAPRHTSAKSHCTTAAERGSCRDHGRRCLSRPYLTVTRPPNRPDHHLFLAFRSSLAQESQFFLCARIMSSVLFPPDVLQPPAFAIRHHQDSSPLVSCPDEQIRAGSIYSNTRTRNPHKDLLFEHELPVLLHTTSRIIPPDHTAASSSSLQRESSPQIPQPPAFAIRYQDPPLPRSAIHGRADPRARLPGV